MVNKHASRCRSVLAGSSTERKLKQVLWSDCERACPNNLFCWNCDVMNISPKFMANLPRIHPESRKLKTNFSASQRQNYSIMDTRERSPAAFRESMHCRYFFVDSGFLFWYRKKQRNRSVISDLTQQNHVTQTESYLCEQLPSSQLLYGTTVFCFSFRKLVLN